MNAHKFVAEKGIERARDVVELAPQGATHLSKDTGHYVNANFEPMPAHIKEQLPSLIVIAELKQVVESVEIVDQLGGIDSAKSRLKNAKESGSLLLSVSNKNCVSSVYDFKVEEAIKNWELAHE